MEEKEPLLVSSAPEEAAREIRTMVANGVTWADSRKRRFRRSASAVRLLSLVLTALSTIVLGVQDLNVWADLAFSMVAVTTAINALEPFFNWRSRWVLMEEAQYRLNRILDEIDYFLMKAERGNIDIAQLDSYFKRHEMVWEEISSRWLQQRLLDRKEPTQDS